MSRTLNLALLQQLKNRKPALESDEVVAPADGSVPGEEAPVVEPVAEATPEVVAETAAGAGTSAPPTVIIKVEVEQASKPADTQTVEETPAVEPAATEVVGGSTEEPVAAVAEEPAVDTAPTAEAPVETPAETPATDEVPPTDGVEPAVAAATEPAADEVPATDAAAVPAEGEVEPVAAVAEQTPAEATEPGAEPEVGESPEPAVDAAPTQDETDAAAAEVQAAVDAGKEEKIEEGEKMTAENIDGVVAETTPAEGSIDAEQQVGPVDEVEVIVDTPVSAEIDEISEEIATYENGGNALDKIGDILEAAAEEGGVDSTTAKVLEVAVEHIHQTLGIPSSVGIVSMEAFSQSEFRGRATNIAMEDIKKTVAEVWKTIVEGMTQLLKKVVEFYDQVASGSLLQQKKAQALLQSVQKMGSKKVAGTIQSAKLVKSLARGPELSKNIAQDMLATENLLNKAYSHGAELAQLISESVKETDPTVSKQKLIVKAKQLVGQIMSANNNPTEMGVADAPEGTNAFSTQLMIGNNILWAYIPDSEAQAGKLTFGKSTIPVEVQGDVLPILSTDQVKAIATIAMSSAKGLAIAQQTSTKLKQAINDFTAFAKQSISRDQKPDNSMLTALRQLSVGLTRNAAQLSYSLNAAALAYCEASLKKLGGETAPAEAPAQAAPAAAA